MFLTGCSRGLLTTSRSVLLRLSAMQYSPGGDAGIPGSGVGHGGGGGGSIRDAGGAFGRMEAAREEEYFKRLQRLQLKQLREQLDDEIEHHEREMRHHKEQIERHHKRVQEIKHEEQQIEKL